MNGDVSPYLNLVTSEHNQKPNFMAVMAALVQPFADAVAVLNIMPSLFDLDTANGALLDTVGLWIGQSRNLTQPITGVYFSLDTPGLGADQGIWLGPYDSITGLVALPDDIYRTLLRAKIANNQWNGTVPGAYAFMNAVFPGNTFFIQDNSDMTILVGVVGSVALNPLTYALLTGGYLDIKPAGVRISGYVTPSVPGSPLFGLDTENSLISGLDVGGWATITGGR